MTKYTDERKRYIIEWQQQNTRQYAFKFNKVKNPDIVEFLDEKVKTRKLGEYVKELILKDYYG